MQSLHVPGRTLGNPRKAADRCIVGRLADRHRSAALGLAAAEMLSDLDAESFERSLPHRFRSLLVELDAVATPGGNGIVIYRGFNADRDRHASQR